METVKDMNPDNCFISFPKEFNWGVATAAYQVEGARFEDGKGESIWDQYCDLPGKIDNGDKGDIAADHYHRFEEDFALMQGLGIRHYRMSLAWPRIYPSGKGTINQKGIDFYSRLIDSLLAKDVTPMITLYHWDMPAALLEEGGWAGLPITDHFADYASTCFKAFGDRVKWWLTFNEPVVFTMAGYAGNGRQAPGYHSSGMAVKAMQNFHLAHGKAVQAFRSISRDGKIGTTISMVPSDPWNSDSELDRQAAERSDAAVNWLFADPIFRKEYPAMILPYVEQYMRPIATGEMDIIGEPIDYLGINNYVSQKVRHCPGLQYDCETIVPPGEASEFDRSWVIDGAAIYNICRRVSDRYGNPDIYITENGAVFTDILTREGRVHDYKRIYYLKEFLKEVKHCLDDGIHLRGYYLWSLIDNFEWANGYRFRTGIVYVDYATQRRYIKDSGYFYQDLIKNGGFHYGY